MMLLSDVDFLVQKERQKDLLREIARDQLVQAAKRQHTKDRHLSRIVTAWLGGQMVKWGAKLQTYNTVIPAKETVS